MTFSPPYLVFAFWKIKGHCRKDWVQKRKTAVLNQQPLQSLYIYYDVSLRCAMLPR